MTRVVTWIVPLALFWGIWYALMKFFDVPITWRGVAASASIVVLAIALQQRLWWLAVPAAASAVMTIRLAEREMRRPER